MYSWILGERDFGMLTPTPATAQEALKLYDNSKLNQPSDSPTQELMAMIQTM